ILYIEDNISNFAVVKYAFAAQGQNITLLAAEQGTLGLDMARIHQPDLILLDLHLPDIGGDEVLQRLKTEDSTREIPVIILSADATSRRIERLLAAGATAYMTKPLDLRKLFNLVDQALERKEQ
ncbi:MAG: response regulator, partial [Cytophagaceae bacterium]